MGNFVALVLLAVCLATLKSKHCVVNYNNSAFNGKEEGIWIHESAACVTCSNLVCQTGLLAKQSLFAAQAC